MSSPQARLRPRQEIFTQAENKEIVIKGGLVIFTYSLEAQRKNTNRARDTHILSPEF